MWLLLTLAISNVALHRLSISERMVKVWFSFIFQNDYTLFNSDFL